LKNSTKIIAMAAAALMLAPLAGCGSTSSSTASNHTINIGIKFDQPGLGYKDGDKYTGFDVSVAEYVAKELGYSANEIVWKEAPSKQRETLLENGDVDLVFATYSITDDRKKVVDFGGPYFVAGQDLLIRSNDKSITGPDSLDGKKLCSVTGSTSAQVIKDHYANKVQLMEQSGFAECTTALISGTVDAVTTDDIILAGLAAAKGDGQLKVVGKPFSQERYGVGHPQGKDRNREESQYGTEEDDRRRLMEESPRRGHQRHGIHSERQVQSAHGVRRGQLDLRFQNIAELADESPPGHTHADTLSIHP
jgi:glutamate transport system substrate-binding protein